MIYCRPRRLLVLIESIESSFREITTKAYAGRPDAGFQWLASAGTICGMPSSFCKSARGAAKSANV